MPPKKNPKKKKKKKRKPQKIHKDLQLAGASPTADRKDSVKLIPQREIRNSMRRMSVDFMSDDVKRMTMLAAAMSASRENDKKKSLAKTMKQKKEEQQQLNEESKRNEFNIRRTMIHRAIKKMRHEERSKHRQWITKILEPHEIDDPHGVMEEIYRLKNTVNTVQNVLVDAGEDSDDEDGEGNTPFNNAQAVSTSKSLFDVVKKKVAITNISRKLKRKVARPSWYSEYQEAYNYEHRVQKDGFEYIFDYHAHFGNTIKSFFPTAVMKQNRVHTGLQCAFVSLDKTGFNYWEVLSSENQKNLTMEWSTPLTKKRIPFKRRQNEFIQALCWNPALQLYIGAGLDMMAHIYDKHLNYIVALPTGERVIRCLIYNETLDEIIIAGSGGCKSWKLYRSYNNGHMEFDLSVAKVYTKYSQDDIRWISAIEFDNDSQRLILIIDERILCLNAETGELMSLLQRCHDAPVTGCVWYNRSQYFITCCAGGKVKVWAIHHDGDMDYGRHDYALLHVFTGHTKAVTAVQLHPMSGLAVSVSLDGTLRVLNLEALEEIYMLQIMQPLIYMKCVNLAGISMCIGASADGIIRVWSINDCLGFFNVCRAKCQKRYCSYERGKDMVVCVESGEDVRVFTQNGRLVSNLVPGQLVGGIKTCRYSIGREMLLVMQEGRGKGKVLISAFDCRNIPCSHICTFDDPANVYEELEHSTCMFYADIDVATITDFVFNKSQRNRRTSVLKKKAAVDTIINPNAKEMGSAGTGGAAKGAVDGLGKGVMKRMSGEKQAEPFREGETMVDDKVLIFGTSTGTIMFTTVERIPKKLNVFKGAHESRITEIHYCRLINKLVTFGYDVSDTMVIKFWTVPEMRLIVTLPLRQEPTAVGFSEEHQLCGLGYKDGMLQLIELSDAHLIEIDNPHTLEQHTDAICAVSFCDEWSVYCSASRDLSVKVWDYGNRLLDRVVLNKVPEVVFFNGSCGDIVVSQGSYLLKIEKSTWCPPSVDEFHREQAKKKEEDSTAKKVQALFRGRISRRSTHQKDATLKAIRRIGPSFRRNDLHAIQGTDIHTQGTRNGQNGQKEGEEEDDSVYIGNDGAMHRKRADITKEKHLLVKLRRDSISKLLAERDEVANYDSMLEAAKQAALEEEKAKRGNTIHLFVKKGASSSRSLSDRTTDRTSLLPRRPQGGEGGSGAKRFTYRGRGIKASAAAEAEVDLVKPKKIDNATSDFLTSMSQVENKAKIDRMRPEITPRKKLVSAAASASATVEQ